LALIAHNMIRWIALMDAPDRPHYSKKIRRKYIFNAGKLVYHAGQWALRVMESAYERGMKNLREKKWMTSPTECWLTHKQHTTLFA
jgi:hypothetical protein